MEKGPRKVQIRGKEKGSRKRWIFGNTRGRRKVQQTET